MRGNLILVVCLFATGSCLGQRGALLGIDFAASFAAQESSLGTMDTSQKVFRDASLLTLFYCKPLRASAKSEDIMLVTSIGYMPLLQSNISRRSSSTYSIYDTTRNSGHTYDVSVGLSTAVQRGKVKFIVGPAIGYNYYRMSNLARNLVAIPLPTVAAPKQQIVTSGYVAPKSTVSIRINSMAMLQVYKQAHLGVRLNTSLFLRSTTGQTYFLQNTFKDGILVETYERGNTYNKFLEFGTSLLPSIFAMWSF
jgi:hypothetical protein